MKFTTSTVIDGTSYSTTQFTPTRALKILTLLGKVLGGPLGELAGAGGKGLLSMKLDANSGEMFSRALTAMFENLDEEKIGVYVQEILSTTTVGGGGEMVTSNFETRFQGKLPELFKLLKWVLEVNFGDFLKGLVAKGASQVPAEKAL